MIVCICNNVREGAIRKLFKKGKSVAEVVTETGAGTGCASCLRCLRQIRDEEVIKKLEERDDHE